MLLLLWHATIHHRRRKLSDRRNIRVASRKSLGPALLASAALSVFSLRTFLLLVAAVAITAALKSLFLGKIDCDEGLGEFDTAVR